MIIGLVGYLRRNPLQAPDITPAAVREARIIWAGVQRDHGFKGSTGTRLMSPPDANAKIAKNAKAAYSLTLAPAASSGTLQTCVRFADCAAVCVLTSGKGALPAVQRSRNARTDLLHRFPQAFAVILADELQRAGAKYGRGHWAIRLNAASDIPWETVAPWLLEHIRRHGGTAYDYTKAWRRSSSVGYRLTFSVDSRTTDAEIAGKLAAGETVTVVVPVRKGAPMPATWNGFPAVDGDQTDDRTTDAAGAVVLLRGKGKLRGLVDHPLMRAV